MKSIDSPDDRRSYKQSFQIQYEYDVHFTSDVFGSSNDLLRDALVSEQPGPCRVGVLLEDEVAEATPELVERIRAYFSKEEGRFELQGIARIRGGEAAKNDREELINLYHQLDDWHLDRHAYVLTVGGGALLDLTGLAAATFHRGIRYVRIPTTVLSQNDSGVGVKNGVNAMGKKNLLGTFAPPFAVFNDVALLKTLPVRDRIAGMAEAVKVALIRDGEFFEWIEQNADRLYEGDISSLQYLNRRCAELHMHQIANGGDPFERGTARPLDFGHWSAHKLEALSAYDIRHGEAVAIGLALDTRYSVLIGLLEEGADRRVSNLLARLGFTLWNDYLLHADSGDSLSVFRGLQEFREHLGGELTITLLSGIGCSVDVHEMDEGIVVESIEWLQQDVLERAA